ncbi:unnamed protein product [Zymoseptoria tritici ST99CH_3D7]|uniref:Uncharacterized protein n=1 Tax=Zymoseptoria tritici (strain ST99CH_3D7) TaxID=1276538 RepID=A0A1X7S578_ZYMT9|nr:unnamed protein product [Zymoseptoria tritici ST99CH_3D7]
MDEASNIADRPQTAQEHLMPQTTDAELEDPKAAGRTIRLRSYPRSLEVWHRRLGTDLKPKEMIEIASEVYIRTVSGIDGLRAVILEMILEHADKYFKEHADKKYLK